MWQRSAEGGWNALNPNARYPIDSNPWSNHSSDAQIREKLKKGRNVLRKRKRKYERLLMWTTRCGD